MIRIPDTPQFQGSNINASQLSTQAANAPTQALGNIAQAIGSVGVGEAWQAKADQVQKMVNLTAVSTAKQTLDTNFSNFRNELEADQDPASRIEKARQFFAQNEALTNSPDLSPQARQELTAHYGEWAGRRMAAVGDDAHQFTRKRATQALDNEMAAAIERGDGAAVNGVLGRLSSSGLVTPEEVTSMQSKAGKALALRQTQVDITTNPTEWLEKHPAEKIPEGYDPVQWNQQQNFARSKQRERVYDATSSIQDGMASGKITTAQQIDDLSKDLPPTTKEALKEELAKRADVNYRQKISTPAYQQEVVGKVAGMLTDYNPEKEGFDAKFVQMDSLVRSLPPSAVRDELTRQIDNVRKDKLEEPKTHAEAGDKALDEAFKGGLFGKEPEIYTVPTARVVASGFLSKENLTALGLPKDVVKDILKGKTESEKLTLFRQAASPIWNTRENVTASDRIQKAAETMLNGQKEFKYATPEEASAQTSAAIEREAKFGRAKTEYAQWRKVNPNATAKEVDDKVFQLAGEEARKSVQSGKFDPKPVRSVAGGRITSYGYPDDSTPDSNSKVGIGAWVGNDEAARIRRGEDTPNKLKANDFAVSPDVEAQLRSAGVTPGSTVTLRLSDGSTVRGRWMDRTAESYGGKQLTGRWDLYSPTGKSPLDGKAVVGWTQ